MRVSTGSTTVPRALRKLELVHDEVANVEGDVRGLDRSVLAGIPDEIALKLRRLGGSLWDTTGNLAYVHSEILQAAGELDDGDRAMLGRYLSSEHLPEAAKRYGFSDDLADFAGGIVEFSKRYNAFGGAVGTWLAKGGSFSDAYQHQYDQISRDVAPIDGLVTGGTEVALSVIFAPIGLVAHYAEMPLDWRDRYDAASVHLVTGEAKAVSASAATGVREETGSLTDAIPNKVARKAVDHLLQGTEDEQEAGARGIGDMLGAIVDAQHGHPESLDTVMSAVKAGYYGTVLRDSIVQDPASLQHIIGITGHVDAVVVPGDPADRDRPAYPSTNRIA